MRCADNDGNGDCNRGVVGYRLWNPHCGLTFEMYYMAENLKNK